MANFHSIGGNEVEAHYAGGELLQSVMNATGGITGNDAEESAWLTRTSEADGVASVRSIHGRTLRWNQLAPDPLIEGTVWAAYSSTKLSVARQDGKATGTLLTDGSGFSYAIISTSGNAVKGVNGHKYLVRVIASASTSVTFDVDMFNSGGRVLGTAGATPTALATIFTFSNANPSNTLWFYPATAMVTGDTFTIEKPQVFDLTAMFGAGNEPSTVAEFEALYPLPYYEYDAGSLLPVKMLGIESAGFNQWDEEWELGRFDTTTGENVATVTQIRAKNLIPVFPHVEYYVNTPDPLWCIFFDADGNVITTDLPPTQLSGNSRLIGVTAAQKVFTTPANCAYMRFYSRTDYGTTYNHDICINLSDPIRNGEYAPYWHQTRTIPAGTLRGAGSVYDELTETERTIRIAEIDMGSLTWVASQAATNVFYANVKDVMDYKFASDVQAMCVPYAFVGTAGGTSSLITDKAVALYYSSSTGTNIRELYVKDSAYSDAAAFKAAMDGVILYYEVATPTVTEFDQPLNMTYRTEQGGTERVMVPTGENSAPPTIVAAQGYTSESLRDAALSAIAPVENGLASANYGIGSYLVHAGQLCRVTTAIATGETITIGTNVTATTVMAEILSLVQ